MTLDELHTVSRLTRASITRKGYNKVLLTYLLTYLVNTITLPKFWDDHLNLGAFSQIFHRKRYQASEESGGYVNEPNYMVGSLRNPQSSRVQTCS